MTTLAATSQRIEKRKQTPSHPPFLGGASKRQSTALRVPATSSPDFAGGGFGEGGMYRQCDPVLRLVQKWPAGRGFTVCTTHASTLNTTPRDSLYPISTAGSFLGISVYSQSGDHPQVLRKYRKMWPYSPQEVLAKIVYRPDMHYNSLLVLLYFRLHTEIKCRNLAIFIFFSLLVISKPLHVPNLKFEINISPIKKKADLQRASGT